MPMLQDFPKLCGAHRFRRAFRTRVEVQAALEHHALMVIKVCIEDRRMDGG